MRAVTSASSDDPCCKLTTGHLDDRTVVATAFELIGPDVAAVELRRAATRMDAFGRDRHFAEGAIAIVS